MIVSITKKLTIGVWILVFSVMFNTRAQINDVLQPSSLFESADDIEPLSPSANELFKMVNYPVNYNTGVPEISIPLHEVRSGDLVMPISLNYHAGGFKISDRSTRIGLGWSLSCDLQITRQINGISDLVPKNGYKYNDMTCYDPLDESFNAVQFNAVTDDEEKYAGMVLDKRNISAGMKWDSQPDQFVFKLLDKTGKFYIKKDALGNYEGFVTVPYSKIKIEHQATGEQDGSDYNHGRFIITDIDGTRYFFGHDNGAEKTEDYLGALMEGSGNAIGENGSFSDFVGLSDQVITWKCYKIENASRTHSITMEYQYKPTQAFAVGDDQVTITHAHPSTDYHSAEQPTHDPINYSNMSVQDRAWVINQRPQINISFKGEAVEGGQQMIWNYNHWMYPREGYSTHPLPASVVAPSSNYFGIKGLSLKRVIYDNGEVIFDLNTLNGHERLTRIRDIGEGGTLKKNILFYHHTNNSYNRVAVATDNTLYLDSLDIQLGGKWDRYKMTYNECYVGPQLRGHDAWGHFNEHTQVIRPSQWKYDMYSTRAVFVPSDPDNFLRGEYTLGLGIFGIDVPGVCTNSYGCQLSSLTTIQQFLNGDETRENGSNISDYYEKGLIKGIIYPTGGMVTYDFEPNQYLIEISNPDGLGGVVKRPALAGGVRIKNINYYNQESGALKLAQQKHFRYGEYEDGNGVVMNPPLRDQFGNILPVKIKKELIKLSCESRADPFDPSKIVYSTREVAWDSLTTYMPSSSLTFSYADGSPIRYLKVAEYNRDYGRETGKTVYEYYHPEDHYHPVIGPSISFSSETNFEGHNEDWYENTISGDVLTYIREDWFRGGLKAMNKYAFDVNKGSYYRIYRKENEYTIYSQNEHVMVMNGMSRVDRVIPGGSQPYMPACGDLYAWESYSGGMYQDFFADMYSIPVGSLKLTKETEWWYDEEPRETIYTYNSQGERSTITRKNSSGDQIKTNLYYTYDRGYTGMVNRNIVEPVVEEVITNITRGRELKRTKVDFSLFSSGAASFYKPAAVRQSFNGATMEVVKSYVSYDHNANLLEMVGRDEVPVSYIWGYAGQRPVVQLIGVGYNDIPATYKTSSILASSFDAIQIQSEVEELQEEFSGNELVNGYIFDSKLQLKKIIPHNGLVKGYTYDSSGKLNTEKDKDGNILNYFEYNTKNTNSTNVNQGDLINLSQVPLETSSPQVITFEDCGHAYNYLVPGGTEQSNAIGISGSADAGAYSWGVSNRSSDGYVDCSESNPDGLVPVRLRARTVGNYSYPYYMYLDFYKDENELVASRMFVKNELNTYYSTVKISPGTYKVVFRVTGYENSEGYYTPPPLLTFDDGTTEELINEQNDQVEIYLNGDFEFNALY